MATLTDVARSGEFVIWEPSADYAREEVVVDATGGAMVAGTILGKVTATGKYIEHVNAAVDGSEVAVAILYEAIGVVEDNRTIYLRQSIVASAALTYDGAGVVADIDAELLAVGIVVR